MTESNRYPVVIDDCLEDLIPSYLEHKVEECHELTDAIQKNDYEFVEKLGHRMKGEGRGYGFEEISTIGGKLETEGKNHQLVDSLVLVQQLEHYILNLDITYEEMD